MLAFRAKTDRGLFFGHAPVFIEIFVFPIHKYRGVAHLQGLVLPRREIRLW